MARLEYVKEAKDNKPESVERIEVRVWGLAGARHQSFLIGSGMNFHANSNLLLEIVYSVNGIQFFYTRDYLHLMEDAASSSFQGRLEMFQFGEDDSFGFRGLLPECSILLKRETFTYQDENDQETTGEIHHLEISADVGAILGHASPGMREICIRFPYIDQQEGLRFMKDLMDEIVLAQQGQHLNPADLPQGASDWPFIRQLNQRAYDRISEHYQEEYFSNPLLTEMFDSWLEQLPLGAHILDAGCGHGDPVIGRLLEKGYRVTGTDLSPKMLERARQSFPGVDLVNQMVSEVRWEAQFDAVCSFSSLLYLDPIDLSHSLYRLYHALKPGGLLFLYGHDQHPNSRGLPYDVDISQWMWIWSHSMEEAAQALEEFGCFKVLKMEDVTLKEVKEKQEAEWRQYKQEQHEKLMQTRQPGLTTPILDLSRVTDKLPYSYTIIARRQGNAE